ncbi:hypothetical protein D3C80_1154110 [compost metagenome]
MVFAVVQVVRQVAGHVREQHVVGDVGGDHHANAGHQAAPVLGGHFPERHLGPGRQAFAVAFLQLVDVLLEGWRLLQRMAQVQADDAQRQGEKERQAPTPFEELVLTQHRRDQHHHTGTQHEPGNRAEVQPTTKKPPFSVRGIFGDEDRRAGVLAPHREALGHLGQQQQDRRPDTDAGIGRYQADGEGAERHDHDGCSEDFLPPEPVTQGTEEQPAQRPDQKRHRERGQRRDHLHARVGIGEENLAQGVGDEAVDTEVEPLHGIAQCRRGDCLAHLGVVDNGDVLQADWLEAFLARFHVRIPVDECSKG